MILRSAGKAVQKLRLFIPLLALAVAACDDPFGPQIWSATPYTLTVYSASRAEYTGLVSAFDLTSDPVLPISIEAPGATGNWDFVLIEQQNGLALLPGGALEGLVSRARIGVIEGRDFLTVAEAPRDTAAYSAGPVALRTGVVYVMRSRRSNCGFTTGHRYAKMQVLEVDQARGVAHMAIVRNPYCDDRSLVPPEL
jgi:hypothetical protein